MVEFTNGRFHLLHSEVVDEDFVVRVAADFDFSGGSSTGEVYGIVCEAKLIDGDVYRRGFIVVGIDSRETYDVAGFEAA